MSDNKNTDVLVKIVELLTPLTSEERQRIVKSALMFIGDTALNFDVSDEGSANTGQDDQKNLKFLPKVQNWLKQNDITMEELEEVFHFSDSNPEFIASDILGKDAKEKTQNAYIISGISKFLFDGTGTFDDKNARELCKTLGCYDNTNHSKYIKDIGKVVAGTKDKGWALTAPGLKKAASLIKEMGKA